MTKLSHLIFTNPHISKGKIPTNRDGNRNIKNEEDNEEEEEKDYTLQKASFNIYHQRFTKELTSRHTKRTLQLPYHYDFIRIDFFKMFSDDSLTNQYGIKPIVYYATNMSVLFQITDNTLFSNFLNDIKAFSSSEGVDVPSELKSLSIINEFYLLTSERIQQAADPITTLKLLLFSEKEGYTEIYNHLKEYIKQHNGKLDSIASYSNTYELQISPEYIPEILDNFDIIQRVQSLPVMHVSPNAFGIAKFKGDFKINKNEVDIDKLPIIGIIDSGVRHISAYEGLIVGESSICPGSYQIKLDHATYVASLIIYGMQNILEDEIIPQARIYSIQAIREDNDKVSLLRLQKEITQSHEKYGIRIYNISMSSLLSKDINADISDYARMLDYLAYTYDILFIISTGNFDDITEDYPYQFYNPADPDYTQNTNLGEPADCMNGITVGAIANCLRNTKVTDMTPDKNIPAYYSKKGFRDYTVKVNNAFLRTHQINWNLSKPDIVMPGGDCCVKENGLIVFGSEHYNYVEHVTGTSFATPLASNLAAQILCLYPSIRMQQLKALIINSARNTLLIKRLDFQNIVDRRKDNLKSEPHYNSQLNSLSFEKLQKMIEGYGIPEITNCLYSQENEVTYVVSGRIPHNTFNVHHFKLPPSLKMLKTRGKILQITGTLCFSVQAIIADNSLLYNPYHVSFRIMNAQENEEKTLDAIKKITNEEEGDKTKRKETVSIKGALNKWSEDFGYYNKHFFSNTQHKQFTIDVADLEKINDEIAVVFRCLAKENFQDTAIEYAFVLTLQSEEINRITDYSLYAELKQLNNSAYLSESIELHLEEEAEADLNN